MYGRRSLSRSMSTKSVIDSLVTKALEKRTSSENARPSGSANPFLNLGPDDCLSYFKIKMLPQHLRNSLFGPYKQDPQSISDLHVRLYHSICEKSRHGIKIDPVNERLSVIRDRALSDVVLPPFMPPPPANKSSKTTLETHFDRIAESRIKPYLDLADQLVNARPLPPRPRVWAMDAGWTKYAYNTNIETGEYDIVPKRVVYPDADALVFDVETCVRDSPNYPLLAVAASPTHWYSWTSPRLISVNHACDDAGHLDITKLARFELIPFGYLTPQVKAKHSEKTRLLQTSSYKPKLVVGHNVSFDRSKIADEYALLDNGMRFSDTMSCHMCIRGSTNKQIIRRKALKKEKSAQTVPEKEPPDPVAKHSHFDMSMEDEDPSENVGASLSAIYEYYYGAGLDKAERNFLMKCTLKEAYDNFQNTMQYCSEDVLATLLIFQRSHPELLHAMPSKVSHFGMMEMGKCYLPTSNGWDDYVNRAESKYKANEKKFAESIHEIVKDIITAAIERGSIDQSHYQSNPWHKHLDWTPSKFLIPNSNGLFYPAWIKAMYKLKKGALLDDHMYAITTGLTIIPYLLQMEYEGSPVELVKETIKGKNVSRWGTRDKNGSFVPIYRNNKYYALLVAKEFNADFANPQTGRLTSKVSASIRALASHVEGSYWRSARRRILEQFRVDAKDDFGPATDLQPGPCKAIIPLLVSAGTVTRRAVEKTWLTASNPYKNRIGSELKTNVKAPENYTFIGADVDSQELWISALLGDSAMEELNNVKEQRIHGMTPISWMTIVGDRKDQTDLHSATAKIVGCTRDQAKVLNYSRMYGAGLGHMVAQLSQSMPESLARQMGAKLMKSTKGEFCTSKEGRFYPTDRTKILEDVISQNSFLYSSLSFEGDSDNADAAAQPISIMAHSNKTMYLHGSESQMFNKLEEIATREDPATPFLGARMSAALRPASETAKHLPSKVNWVVQSSAVDFLHLVLTNMDYLIRHYNLRARFSISIHDEVRYLCHKDDVPMMAYALHLTNLYVRSYFSMRLKFNDLPQSVAFFSAVDEDPYLRKDPFDPSVTPSSPDPLPNGKCWSLKDTLPHIKDKVH